MNNMENKIENIMEFIGMIIPLLAIIFINWQVFRPECNPQVGIRTLYAVTIVFDILLSVIFILALRQYRQNRRDRN